jgi:ribonuclease HI
MDLALFTDVSVNPVLKIGIGASLLLSASCRDLPFQGIEMNEITTRIKVQRFGNTSSTKLELETVLWALGEHRKASKRNLNLYTDSQCISGLLKRKSRLRAAEFNSKATSLPLRNAPLYRSFYALHDEMNFKITKIEGHARTSKRDITHRIFSIVDREARKALRLWMKELREASLNSFDKTEEKKWCVYVLKCRDGSLYTGITNDLEHRLKQHEAGKGSKYVRSRSPFELVRMIPCKDAGEARRLEYEMKRLTRKEKIAALKKRSVHSS